VKSEEEEYLCHCLVCKSIGTGEIEVEENEEKIQAAENPIIRLRFRLKKRENIVEEVGQLFEQVEEKHQELLKNLEQLEATDTKLVEVEGKNQELLKNLEELRADKLVMNNLILFFS